MQLFGQVTKILLLNFQGCIVIFQDSFAFIQRNDDIRDNGVSFLVFREIMAQRMKEPPEKPAFGKIDGTRVQVLELQVQLC
ncbi:hypothetical protein D3C73_975550 [compost metagenome]